MTRLVLTLLLALLPAAEEPAAWPVLLPGRWVGVEKGDAVKGGKVVDGGARVRFVHGQRESRTPWNMSFLLPRLGHMTSETISGGCGFYPSGTAFCRGYGISEKGKAMETRVSIEMLAENRVRISVDGLFAPIDIVRE